MLYQVFLKWISKCESCHTIIVIYGRHMDAIITVLKNLLYSLHFHPIKLHLNTEISFGLDLSLSSESSTPLKLANNSRQYYSRIVRLYSIRTQH